MLVGDVLRKKPASRVATVRMNETVAIAAHSVPAPPKMMMSTAPSTTAAPSPTSVPAATTVPGPSSGPTFQVLPCIPMPFCV